MRGHTSYGILFTKEEAATLLEIDWPNEDYTAFLDCIQDEDGDIIIPPFENSREYLSTEYGAFCQGAYDDVC